MTSYEIPARLRAKWLRGRRMAQICSLLNVYAQTVPAGSARSDRTRALSELFDAADRTGLPSENPAIAALRFLRRVTDSAGLLN